MGKNSQFNNTCLFIRRLYNIHTKKGLKEEHQKKVDVFTNETRTLKKHNEILTRKH